MFEFQPHKVPGIKKSLRVLSKPRFTDDHQANVGSFKDFGNMLAKIGAQGDVVDIDKHIVPTERAR